MPRIQKITIGTMAALTLLLVFNQVQISSIHRLMHPDGVLGAQASDEGKSSFGVSSGLVQQAAAATIPTGVPSVKGKSGVINYGAELGISYDEAAQSIPILARYEQETRPEKLEGEKLERYIAIGMSTACEFCCSARTLVFQDGRKACGCAHSAAMRGLVAYLLDNYGDELTDEQILTEANMFKAAYFPRQSVEKVLAASSNGNIDTSALNQLSPQVGGC